ncbi:MAG TPA: hypothetical protein PKA17_09290, partial [Phenylobacterium sp.]|nr:hypothetical protein [Phenylobacterium sp.]
MGRIFDPAQKAKAQLRLAEQRARARAEAAAVAAGVAETVALSAARGAEFETPPPPAAGGARAVPYRRQTGLDWLARKGRIGARQKAAGERYGVLFRRAAREGALRSPLDVRPGGGGPAGPGRRE